MQITILVEQPENSGAYVSTGEMFDDAAQAIEFCLDAQARIGSRHVAAPYDGLRRAPLAMPLVTAAEAEPAAPVEQEAQPAAAEQAEPAVRQFVDPADLAGQPKPKAFGGTPLAAEPEPAAAPDHLDAPAA